MSLNRAHTRQRRKESCMYKLFCMFHDLNTAHTGLICLLIQHSQDQSARRAGGGAEGCRKGQGSPQ